MIFNSPPPGFNPKVAVAACFIEHGNQVLFIHRAEHISQGGTWAIPAGKIHKDETPEQAIRREVLEECKFNLVNPTFLQIVYIRYPEYDYEYHMFREVVAVKPQVIIDPNESQDYSWITRAQANELDAAERLILDEMPCIELVYTDKEFGDTNYVADRVSS